MANLTFEERLPEIQAAIRAKRHKWRLTAMSFEDAEAIIIARVYFKYNQYDPSKGEFGPWLGRVVSRALINVLRNASARYQRPCVTGCPFAVGDDGCTQTPSKKQCSECPFYRKWEKRKKAEFNVKQTLPMENHTQEVWSKPADSLDIERAEKVIRERIKDRLSERDYEIYTHLIAGHEPKEISVIMGFVKKPGATMYGGYLIINGAVHRIHEASIEIAREEGLI